jgi:hypothetical protein
MTVPIHHSSCKAAKNGMRGALALEAEHAGQATTLSSGLFVAVTVPSVL